MRVIWLAMVGTFALAVNAVAADIALPNDGDAYTALVARAAAHDESVDFLALRRAYLGSAADKRADTSKVRDLTQAMVVATRSADDAATVRAKAEQILAIDYTDLLAQKLLWQSCKILHDDACADLHHFIEMGLLKSIVQTGDGKACATGWEALQVKEEYFVLNMMGATVTRQALMSGGGHTCDAMSVKDENGAAQTYFFNIDRMMQAEADALGIKPGQ